MNLSENHKTNTPMGDIQCVVPSNSLDEVEILKNRNKQLKEKLTKKYYRIDQLEKRILTLEKMTLVSQSGITSDSDPAPGTRERESSSTFTEQITAFADQDAGWTTEKVGYYDATMDLGNTSDSDLGSFLKRPIRQSAQTWTVGQPFYYTFNPWTSFCENPYVRDKIKNYELIRMKLHVKSIITGTKFHYGRALASYNPLSDGDQITKERNWLRQDFIQASQKPHYFLNPTKNAGGELVLPFFWPQNYLSIPSADWRKMGDITISSFGNLLHANEGDDPVTITTYIWAEDIVLTVPTTSDPPLTSQSGRRLGKKSDTDSKNTLSSRDEYGEGIISKPASAVAKASGALSSLPLIGPYMRATEIGANATGRMAQLFGYSRPNIVSDIQQIKPLPTGNLANVDAADGAMKLTLDSKAELTVDSRTVGLDGTDEMGILDYCKRESYLTTFNWSPNDKIDDLLWNTYVLPMQLDHIAGEIHMTPLAHMATCFERWQGSLKFRFQIIKSDYHKGRLLVRWDPNAISTSVNYNVNYSRVIDIAETEDFEIVVGWGQSTPWKSCGVPFSTGSLFSENNPLNGSIKTAESNGILGVSVLGDLVCPSIDAPITVNVFVSACDDFKLAAPRNEPLSNYHLFPIPTFPEGKGIEADDWLESQSGMVEETTESDKPTSSANQMTIGSQSDQNDATYLVFYGDPPTSIRELCKRYVFTRFWYPPQVTAGNTVRINTLRNKNAPYYTGFDATGVDVAKDGVRGMTLGPTTFSSWFTPAYAGVRGSYRKKYLFSGPNSAQAPVVTRDIFRANGNGNIIGHELSIGSGHAMLQKFLTSKWGQKSGNGTASTNLGINNTIEVELPYYSPVRFSKARTIGAQALDCNSHDVKTTDVLLGPLDGAYAGNSVVYQQYDAVGEDFSLFFFTGVPIYYQYVMDDKT